MLFQRDIGICLQKARVNACLCLAAFLSLLHNGGASSIRTQMNGCLGCIFF
ncbi:hypothetical protein ANAPC5_01091 [Anaplasma phagocytophilum]|nr:hypothetical protein ANAPC5_01091 [Anaplasma phagocytophilum]